MLSRVSVRSFLSSSKKYNSVLKSSWTSRRSFGLLPTRWAEDWVSRLLEKEPVIQLPLTGPEAAEANNANGWKQDYLDSPFGTFDSPTIVPSMNTSRIVGCTGGPGFEDEHEITWHVVHEGRPLVCMDCGQVYKLLNVNDFPFEELKQGLEQDEKIVQELAATNPLFKEEINFEEADEILERPTKRAALEAPRAAEGVELLAPSTVISVEKLKPLPLESLLEKLKKEGSVLVEEEETASNYNLTKTLENKFSQ